jgi:hypothetical protein
LYSSAAIGFDCLHFIDIRGLQLKFDPENKVLPSKKPEVPSDCAQAY